MLNLIVEVLIGQRKVCSSECRQTYPNRRTSWTDQELWAFLVNIKWNRLY